MRIHTSRSGFSTIIAMLLTAFLTVLSAGVLNIFVSENRINHFLFDGIATYIGAEWSLEYGMLKIKNHREGFSDAIDTTGDEQNMLAWSADRKLQISYAMKNSGKSYSGTITKGQFEIIPLFYDDGTITSGASKNPNPATSTIKKTLDFLVQTNGDIVWNILGNDSNGTTFGISGTGGLGQSFGNNASASIKIGFEKYHSDDRLKSQMRSIESFIGAYDNSYLVLYSVSDTPISYSMTSSNGFSFPTTSIIASSSIGTSKQNIEFKENRSKLFDMLKYSLFNK